MSSSTFDAFERYKQKGLDARRAGQWASARIYLLEAARSVLDLSKQAGSESLQQARRDTAQRLLELAKDCETAATQKKRPPARSEAMASSTESASADGWLVSEKPNVRFDDVAGLDDVKEDIRLKMLYPFEHPELAEKFGLKTGGGILLYGPPGTGKTLLARATAGEIDAAFFRISAADVMSKWVGEAEQNVAKLLAAAKAEPRSIIFIDEIESLLPARRDDGGTSVMQRVVPQMLQAMQGFDGKSNAILWMGATNVPWQLDPAALRPGRFDEKIYVPLPDVAARRQLLMIHLSHRPLAKDVDLIALADRLDGYSGADIEHLCDRAATVPFLQSVATGEPGEISKAIIEDAINEQRPSVSREQLTEFERWANG